MTAKYSQALDHMALAVAAFRKGKLEKAGKHFALAATAPDAVYAVALLENTNRIAYAEKQKAEAAAKAAKVEATKKEPAKPGLKTEASKRLKAEAEDFVEDEETEDGDDDMDDGDAVVDEVADGDDEDEFVDDEDEAVMAKLLASMVEQVKPQKAKK